MSTSEMPMSRMRSPKDRHPGTVNELYNTYLVWKGPRGTVETLNELFLGALGVLGTK